MGQLYQRNGIWYFDVYDEYGIRRRRSTGTTDEEEAKKVIAKVTTEIFEEKWFDKERGRNITFMQLTTKYMAKYQRTRDQHTIKRLLPVFGKCKLSGITTEMVSDYREKRLECVKPATVYQELSLMRRMINVSRKEWKWIKVNPVADLSFSVGDDNARDRWLTPQEEQVLLAKATNPGWLKLLILTALHTGMRRGEILALGWKDIDFKRRLLTVHKSKNGEKRAIPLSQTLCDALTAVKVRNFSGRVFPLAPRSLRVAFGRALEKTDIKDFRFHDLRHTFATRLVQNGVDLYKVKVLMGHKSIDMTMRYAHHYPESLRSSIEVLDSCLNLGTKGVRRV